jgi:hypothetical protein
VTSNFVTSVASAVSTAAILYMARVIYKAKQAFARVSGEHKFLVRAMQVVLEHLDLKV